VRLQMLAADRIDPLGVDAMDGKQHDWLSY
jgi:hypothetical protein